MRKVVIVAIAGSFVAALGGAAAGVASNKLSKDAQRPDCPGKIVCPITGDVICADQCPLEAEDRAVNLPVAAALPACCAGTSPEEE